ncbi:unnamed protein product [Sphagnum balticum]
MLTESGRPGITIAKESASSIGASRLSTAMATALSPPRSQAAMRVQQQGPVLPGRCKIRIRMLTRQAPFDREALISGLRTRTIKLRRPQSFRRCRQRARKGEEKLG